MPCDSIRYIEVNLASADVSLEDMAEALNKQNLKAQVQGEIVRFNGGYYRKGESSIRLETRGSQAVENPEAFTQQVNQSLKVSAARKIMLREAKRHGWVVIKGGPVAAGARR